MERRRGIFDWIMGWDVTKPFRSFYEKHRETLLYLFFGGLTFFIGVVIYAVLIRLFSIHELISNVISWICGVSFSYFTTKKWVFMNYDWGLKYVMFQMVSFFSARLATLLLQEVLLYIFTIRIGWNGIWVKICTDIINIILNYLVSKFWIFRKGN